ncbi:MAG: winged helix-turn-helix domain-containing protein [Acidimicrobiales bacterium]
MALRFEGFCLDPERFQLRHDGELIAMEPQVFDVLVYLIDHRDRIVSKGELLDNIWGDRFVSESALTSRIKTARRLLGDDGTSQRFIETARGRGYRFIADVSSIAEPTVAPSTGEAVRPVGPTGLPSGTVTFLFTDVEGSTKLWEQDPEVMRVALERHDELLRSAIEKHGGHVFSRAGDSFAAAFGRVGDAVAASSRAQESLAGEEWPPSCPIRVRMGLHVGEAQERDGNYFGAAVNRAARIMAGGHGGQILVSSAVAAVDDSHDLVDLGDHRLKDLAAAERVFQVGGQSFPPLRTLDAVRHNLPVERTLLVGREREIEQVGEMVRDHRLVMLLGIGGTGKTRLATAVAADQADQFADGVWFVDLVPATTRDHLVEAVASAAGLQLNRSDRVAELAELISTRQMLVVLDNCEHITDEVADVVDVLLERTSASRWLATSREPLQLPDERQVHISPLAVDDDLDAPAIQLFVAAAERVNAVIDSDDLPTVVDICASLDGLPLSIELAAAQLRHLSLRELAARLDRRFEILRRSGGGRMRRQASLQAVLEDTWEMIDDRERELLQQLAAFPSVFAVDDVEAVSDDLEVGVPTLTLAGLVDRSLVISDGHGRHRLLETVKLFARQRWAQAPDPGLYLQRHTGWVLGYLGSFKAEEWFTSFEILAWAGSRYDDHRAVEDRLAAAGQTSDLTVLLRSLSFAYTYTTGTRASAAIERIERYLDTLDFSERERGILNLVAAGAGLPARRPDWIDNGSRRAVPLLRSHGSADELAAALTINSWITVFRDFESAMSMLEEARNTSEQAGSFALADLALAFIGGHNAIYGRVDESLSQLRELEARLSGRKLDFARSMYELLVSAVLVVSEPEKSLAAIQRLTKAYTATEGVGAAMAGGGPLICSCAAHAGNGDVEATQRWLAETEDMIRSTSTDDGLPDLLLPPAVLAVSLGHHDEARRWLTTVRQSAKPTQSFPATVIFRRLRGEVGLQDENPLDSMEIQDVYAEAVAWIESLVPATR